MSVIHKRKLSAFFKSFPPRFLLGTTYTASPVFFETSILTKIDRKNLEGAVVLCDKKGFQMSAQEVGALRAASSSYSLIYPSHSGAFHPKVWIMATDDRVAVLCGSGNMTQSGFMDNVELFDSFELLKDGSEQQLAGELLTFVQGLLEMWDVNIRSERPGLKVIQSLITLINKIKDSNTPNNNRTVSFLSSFAGEFPSQLAEKIDCQELKIASPYFGGKLKGVTQLIQTLGVSNIEIFPASHTSGVDLNPDKLVQLQKRPLRQLNIQKSGFAHLKLYGILDKSGTHYTFTGSVNATQSALGGKNIEAGILRNVDPEYYQALFDASNPEAPLHQEHLDYQTEDTLWLGIHAILRESILTLHVDKDSQKHLPLSEVSIHWICGAQRVESSFDSIFEERKPMRLRQDQFPNWLTGQQNASALEIQGATASGERFRSFTLIEDYSDLTATPQQRNATEAINALFASEGIAEATGISAAMQLISKTLDAKTMDEGFQDQGGKENKPADEKEKPTIVPVWPPRIASDDTPLPVSGNLSSNMAWFQKILGMLLRNDSCVGISEKNNQTDADQDGETESPAPTNQKSIDQIIRQQVKAWLNTEKDFTRLEKRLQNVVLYARPGFKERQNPEYEMPNKEQLLPVAFATFILVYLTHPGDGTPITNDTDSEGNKRASKIISCRADLILRFLHLMIDTRRQPEDYSPPRTHPYFSKGNIFPSILEDIHLNPDLEIHSEFTHLFIAFFALLKMDLGVQNQSVNLLWLKFRLLTANDVPLDEQTVSIVVNKAAHYASVGGESIDQTAIARIIADLDKISWFDFSGYRQFYNILCAQKGASYDPRVTQEIEGWELYLQVLESKRSKAPILEVDGYHPMCVQSGCVYANIRRPALSPLLSLKPCICEGCGTALIPRILIEAHQNHAR